MVAIGPLAEVLTARHPYDDTYGAGTPYAWLVELCGRVVLLGAPLDTVTLVHHVEAVAQVPGKRRVSYGAPVLVDGQRCWRTFSDIDTDDGPCLTNARSVRSRMSSTSCALRSRRVRGGAGQLGRPPVTFFMRKSWLHMR